MDGISRRSLIQGSLVLAGALATSGAALVRQSGSGRIRQSVSRWPFESIPLPDFCRAAKDMGLAAIDLLGPADWDLVHDHGLVCSMGYPTDRKDFIATGFNRVEHHAMLLAELERTIPLARQHGVSNVIAMFGNRNGLSDEEGAEHCIAGLAKIKALAEQEGVTVCVELLNSKVDHHDYQGDHTAWGVRVMQGVGSPRVKLLYDIYHLQIMEGDIIRTITDHIAWIGHFHTGGVPGRRDIDDTQELNYPAVCRAILATGYDGFVAHEYLPKADPIGTLARIVKLCDV